MAISTLRKRTVQVGYRKTKSRNTTLFPVLRIDGNWLSKAGFPPHTQVYIHVQEGRIVINQDELRA
jgi:hypothetical protein